LVLVAPACRDPAAHVREAAGDVSVRRSESGAPVAVRVGQELYEGNVITTAAAAGVMLELSGGNRIDLGERTSLVITRHGGAAAQVGTVLLAGSARVSSAGRGILLTIGTPFGIAEIGAEPSTVELDIASGFRVTVGEVALLTEDGRRVVSAGNMFSIAGIVVPIAADQPSPSADAAEIVLSPLQFTIIANPAQVRIKRRGEAAWRRPAKRDVLGPGDAVRTRAAGDTRFRLVSWLK
jgi:hypothetical protein